MSSCYSRHRRGRLLSRLLSEDQTQRFFQPPQTRLRRRKQTHVLVDLAKPVNALFSIARLIDRPLQITILFRKHQPSPIPNVTRLLPRATSHLLDFPALHQTLIFTQPTSPTLLHARSHHRHRQSCTVPAVKRCCKYHQTQK